MYLTIAVYDSDGVQQNYAVPFSYIKKEYVKVYSQAPNGAGLYTTALVPLEFLWLNEGMIQLTAPVPVGQRVYIRRETYADTPLVDYQDAAILVEEDLDTATLQTLHVAQEAKDANGLNLAEVTERVGDTLDQSITLLTNTLQEAERAKTEADKAQNASERALAAATRAEAIGEVMDVDTLRELVDNKAPTAWVEDTFATIGKVEEVLDTFQEIADHKVNEAPADDKRYTRRNNAWDEAGTRVVIITPEQFLHLMEHPEEADDQTIYRLSQEDYDMLNYVYNTKKVITESGIVTADVKGWHKVTCIGGGGAGGGGCKLATNGGNGGGEGGSTSFGEFCLATGGAGGGGGGANGGGGGGGAAGTIETVYVYLTIGQSVLATVGAGGLNPAEFSTTLDGQPGHGIYGGIGGLRYTGGGGAMGAGNGMTPYSNTVGGIGGNGGKSGFAFGNGGGGGGANFAGNPLGGLAGGPGASSGSQGVALATAANNGGNGGSGCIILEYYNGIAEVQ